MYDCIVIGGGIAGLSAAIHLLDRKMDTLLIDAGKYPSQKICGEFLSPECLPLLQKWGISSPASITKASFHLGKKQLNFKLPGISGSLSRFILDAELLNIGLKKGLNFRPESSVSQLDRNSKGEFQVTLSTGECFLSRQVIVASGKLPFFSAHTQPMCYKGFKAHFSGNGNEEAIEMFLFPHAYLGISSVGNGVYNLACIASLNGCDPDRNPGEWFHFLKSIHPSFNRRMQNLQMIFPEWLTGQIPEFGIRDTPNIPGVYFLGDAAGTIPPACGGGLSMGLWSGCLVADYVLNKDWQGFKTVWLQLFASPIWWGKQLHRTLMNPWMANAALLTSKFFPSLPQNIFQQTRIDISKNFS